MRAFVAYLLMFLMLISSSISAGLLDDMGIDSDASEKVRQQEFRPKAKSKPPAQHSSAESLPPLPLPVVPLRRTEKKNPPRPPVELILV